MLSFWVLTGLLTCIATALVVWPLVSRRHAAPADRSDEEARRLAVYRDRRRELQADRESGRLTAEEAERALDELVAEAARQFPDADAALQAPDPSKARRHPALATAALAALAVPLVALGVYSAIGTPAIVGQDASAPEVGQARIAQAIQELEARVRTKPDDAEGWTLLAEALRMQNEPARAAQAYSKAVALLPPDARLLADYAETLAMVHNGEFAGKPMDLLDQALRIDPRDTKALSLMAAARYRSGNVAEALRLLRVLIAEIPAGAPEYAQMKDVIAQLEGELAGGGGGAAGAGGAAPRPAGPAQGPVTGAPDGAAQGAQRPAAPAGAAVVSGVVTIDDALRAGLAPGATLFIVARDPDGPRTPLAVRRTPVGNWPVRFELGDADAMDPSRPISTARSLVIEARVSASGQAMRQSGEPIGASAPVAPGGRDVTIRIDRQVP